MTQDDLAGKIGVNRPVIGSYEEGRAEPKIAILIKLAALFSVSVDNLVTTDISAQGAAGLITNSILPKILTTVVNDRNEELIAVVPAKASAGYLNGYADPEYIESLPRFSLPLAEISRDRSYRAFQIRGDSMEPVPSGSYIIGEYLNDWHTLKDGKTYIVITRDEGMAYKRVYLHPGGELWLKSDNPVYEPYSVHTNRILEIWRAVGYISTMMPEPETPSLGKLTEMVLELKKEIDDLKKK